MSHVGERIRQLRLAQRLSQRELASRINKLLGVSTEASMTAHYVYRVEKGMNSPSVKYLGAFAEALSVHVKDLFEQAGDQEVSVSEFNLPSDLKEFFDQRRSRGEAEPMVLLAREVNRLRLTPEEEDALLSMLRALAGELAKQIKGASSESSAEKV